MGEDTGQSWESFFQGLGETAVNVWKTDREFDYKTEALKYQQINPLTGQTYYEGQTKVLPSVQQQQQQAAANMKTMMVVGGLALVALIIVKG